MKLHVFKTELFGYLITPACNRNHKPLTTLLLNELLTNFKVNFLNPKLVTPAGVLRLKKLWTTGVEDMSQN